MRVLHVEQVAGVGVLRHQAQRLLQLTERALATFEPAERETVIRALAAIRRNLSAG